MFTINKQNSLRNIYYFDKEELVSEITSKQAEVIKGGGWCEVECFLKTGVGAGGCYLLPISPWLTVPICTALLPSAKKDLEDCLNEC